MLYIEPRHLAIIQSILFKYPYKFYAFGSRARGNPKPLSDLDLCFLDLIPSSTLSLIEAEFEESDLPYKVDLVDWNKCSEEFRARIKKDLVPIELTTQ